MQHSSTLRGTRPRAWLLLVALAAGATGCHVFPGGSTGESALRAQGKALLAHLAADAEDSPGLRVRLAFPASADLDLFVTGPLEESVYFANERSKIGGELERDVRCDASGRPRVETVRFPEPPPGRYRVGIDFPSRCDSGSEPVAFTVMLEHGADEKTQTGIIRPHDFLTIVLEHHVRSPQ